MENEITLHVEQRTLIGKKVKRLRAEGWVPGIVYGRETESVAVQIPRADLVEAYQQAGTSNMIGLLVGRQRKPRPTFIREVQRDPLSLEILHVDLETVDLDRPITALVPIVLVGEAPVEEEGLGVLTRGVEEIEVHCLPADVPSRIEVDVSCLEQSNQVIHVRDLELPQEVEILTDPETTVAYIARLRPVIEEVEEEEIEELVVLGAEEEAEEEVEEEAEAEDSN